MTTQQIYNDHLPWFPWMAVACGCGCRCLLASQVCPRRSPLGLLLELPSSFQPVIEPECEKLYSFEVIAKLEIELKRWQTTHFKVGQKCYYSKKWREFRTGLLTAILDLLHGVEISQLLFKKRALKNQGNKVTEVPTFWMIPFSMYTSDSNEWVALTTRPPLMRMFWTIVVANQ